MQSLQLGQIEKLLVPLGVLPDSVTFLTGSAQNVAVKHDTSGCSGTSFAKDGKRPAPGPVEVLLLNRFLYQLCKDKVLETFRGFLQHPNARRMSK